MTDGSAPPIVVIAIFKAAVGKYGICSSAPPPATTQAPPKTPRASGC